MSSITAETCARAFISTWVCRFGVPALLTSAHGAQFTSSGWSEVCSILGILRINTTSFHSQSKSYLRARLASSDWVTHLPLVMLGLRSLPKDNSSFSPGEAIYGSNLSLPGKFLKHSPRLNKQSRVSLDLLDIM